MNVLIKRLDEIDFILSTFKNQLFDKDEVRLKIEFNDILLSLKKCINKDSINFKYKFDYPSDVIDKMIEILGYKKDFATNKNRNREFYVVPRQYAQTICKYIFKNKSLGYIGSYFSNSDHATVLHSVKTVKNLVSKYSDIRAEFEEVQEKILGFIYIKF